MSETSALDGAHAEHRAARARLLRAARGLPPERWLRARAPGKWSPAEICEHLALADAAALRELETGAPMHMPLPAWKRALLRWTVLRWIIVSGRFPRGAPAPRETRPKTPEPDAARAAARLEANGPRLEAALRARGEERARVTHPYFGVIGARAALRLVARHIDHHARQIEAAGG